MARLAEPGADAATVAAARRGTGGDPCGVYAALAASIARCAVAKGCV
ncbi:hypothetical protein [Streptomyces sp. NPDC085529]